MATVPGDKRLVAGVGGTPAAELPEVLEWPALRFNTFVLGLTEPLSGGRAPPQARGWAARPGVASRAARAGSATRRRREPAVDQRPHSGRVDHRPDDRLVRRPGQPQARGGLPADQADAVISMERRDGRPLRIGHRGAPALAPANTLSSFRAAVEVGVDLVELDVLARPGGELVVSHSPEEIVPETPTLDDALRFFVEEAPGGGRSPRSQADGAASGTWSPPCHRHGLADRTFVSSYYLATARAIAEADSDIRTGITIPRSVLGISDEGRGARGARVGLGALRRASPPRRWFARCSRTRGRARSPSTTRSSRVRAFARRMREVRPSSPGP